MKHTLTPWLVEEAGHLFNVRSEGLPKQAFNNIVAKEIAAHDVFLIAAAPELFEACKLALDYLQKNDGYRDGGSYQKLVKAIAKAEGNSQ